MLRYTRLVRILLYAHLLCITTAWFCEAAALRHHEEISSMTKGLTRSSDKLSGMPTATNVNGWCRRCLRIQDDEALPPVADEESPPSSAVPRVPPPVTVPPPLAATDLPALPIDPDAPPSPRTNPSSLLTPSGSSVPGLGDSGTGNLKPSSVLEGKAGFSAGVGLTAGVGLGVLLLGVLYYFKPELFFLCCKTCVRVQVFHHSAAQTANANSKK